MAHASVAWDGGWLRPAPQKPSAGKASGWVSPDQLRHRSRQKWTYVLEGWPKAAALQYAIHLCLSLRPSRPLWRLGSLFGDLAPLQRRGPPRRFPDQKWDGTHVELSRNQCKAESHRPQAGGTNPLVALTRLCSTLVTGPGGLHPRQDFELERRQTNRQADRRLQATPPFGEAARGRPERQTLQEGSFFLKYL